MLLNKEEIRKLIEEKQLISEFIDLETQLQPNGFDLTVRSIEMLKNRGEIDFSNANRKLPQTEEIKSLGFIYPNIPFWNLKQGTYLLTFNEVLKLPKNIAGISNQRSTMMRCGVSSSIGFWDAGYEGRGKSLIFVHNSHGLLLHQNARVSQMFFLKVNETVGYNGNYQKEGV